MEQIYGYIERITFQSPETGYTVAQLKEPRRKELTCIVGHMPTIQPGETVRCKGMWKNHLIHGKQFEVQELYSEYPADLLGIKKYLGSGLIKGIGPIYANRIVEEFGLNTLDIIDQTPEKLLEISGLGEKRLGKIKQCWAEQKSIRDLMLFLQSYGVSPSFAQKIFKCYGDQGIQKVKTNPFNLAKDIIGIGFKTADTIAQKMGIAKNAETRIDAGIEFVLSELASDGHVCYPVDEFLSSSATMLEVDRELVNTQLSSLKQQERIELFNLVAEGQSKPFIWMKALFVAETGIVRELMRLKKGGSSLRDIDTEKALNWVQEQLKIELAPNQKLAVSQSLSGKLNVITGGPGTGKSTITKAILKITEQLSSKITLTAPTGRAAKRMTEITGKKAYTIHSLLEYDFKNGGFKRNRNNPLEADLLIVDEASMIDTFLMYNLLKAIPDQTRLIFVGDIHQLPSVGPGNVLKDLIQSKRLFVNQLTDIYRQAAGSRIITNAHLINNGSFPKIDNNSSSDFFFIEATECEDVIQQIVELVSIRLPKKYGFHAMNEIQVLAPMKRGSIGTENLNNVLQSALNSSSNPLFRNGQKYLVGDKVMQIRNDYNKEVFNGDVGKITTIDFSEQQLIANFEEREVIYDFSELDELSLAYAVSVHKYQGSECPCIVMPVHTSHFKLLHRNLLYTGVTRGKRLVVLVGTKKALVLAVKNDEVKHRHTGLYQALVNMM